MPFWNRGGGDGGAHEEADDFEEYDPTPYGGGYDLHLTFGRPLPPSDETCYPLSTATPPSVDYDRPTYSSGSIPSTYEPPPDSDLSARYCHTRPTPDGGFISSYSKVKPDYGRGGGEGEYGSGHSRPKPEYGYGGGESEYGSNYAKPPEFGWGEEGRPKPEYGDVGGDSGYGSGYSKPRPEYEPTPDSDPGARHCYTRPTPDGGFIAVYGSGQSMPKPDYGYGGGESQYGSNYAKPPEYGWEGERPKPEYGYGGGEGEYGSGYSKPKPEYGGGESEYGSRYSKPSSYGQDEGEGYGRPKYGGNDSDDEEKKRHHHKHHTRRHHDDD